MDSRSGLVGGIRRGILLCAVVGFAGGGWSRAEVVNDGTTTNRLVRLANPDETAFGNVTVIRVSDSGDFIIAEQIDLGFIPPFPALRSAWYSSSASVTGIVHRVTADFQPAAATPAHQGGVVGWLNPSSRQGIVLKVVPAAGGEGLPYSFQLSHVDFDGTTPAANENLDHLFNLDGEPAMGSFESAWAEPTGYDPAQFARFELDFSAPTTEHLTALSNATALVTAKVYQGGAGGTSTQVGRSLELLTTLPEPDSDIFRVGYYGVWSSFFAGNIIGHYRNLAVEGQVRIQANMAPTVTLTQPAPGTTLSAPATFSLVADAGDPDGTVTRVEFFANAASVGQVTEAPFTWVWSDVPEGNYELTAVATDNLGESTTSAPVTVTVIPWSGTAPEIAVEVQEDMLHLSWGTTGFQLQYKTNLNDDNWTDVPNTVGVSQVDLPVSLGAQYFRLVGSGAPSGPILTVVVSGSSVTVSWPADATGYRLQSTAGLEGTGWSDVATVGNSYSESIGNGSRFYRLIQ